MATLFLNSDSVGQIAKVTGGASRKVAELTSEPGDAGAYADDFQTTFNAEANTITGYVNDRFEAEDTAMSIRFADRQGARTERYVIASADPSAVDFEEMSVVGPERFEELDRSVDRRVVVDWHLSRNAADELRTFVEKFAARGKDPSPSYVAKTAAKYGDSFEGDLFDRMVARYR